MKPKSGAVLCFCILAWISAGSSAHACSESDIQKAKDFMADGSYEQAVSWLVTCAGEGTAGAEVYFQLGKGYLYQGKLKQAEEQFQLAVQTDKRYNPAIGRSYKELGMGQIKKGKIREAKLFFTKAVDHQKELSPAIAQIWFEKGTRTLKRAYFDLAVAMDDAYRIKVFNYLMDKANKGPAAASIDLYQQATAYCGETCDLIKTAGKRLIQQMDDVEKRNPLDKKIARYRDLAGNFVDVPPDFQLYVPGIYPFKLSKGTVTKWIRCKGQGHTTYEFRSDNQKYEVYLRNGKAYRAWAGDSFPESVNSDIKIRALEDTVIFLTLRR